MDIGELWISFTYACAVHFELGNFTGHRPGDLELPVLVRTFLSRLVPGYPGIGHMSGYPGISLYKSGYGRVSLFQMKAAATV